MLGLGKSPQRGLVLPGAACDDGVGGTQLMPSWDAYPWGCHGSHGGLAGSPKLLGQRPPADAPPLREAGKDSGWGFDERESRVWPARGSCQGRAPRRGEAFAHP